MTVFFPKAQHLTQHSTDMSASICTQAVEQNAENKNVQVQLQISDYGCPTSHNT